MNLKLDEARKKVAALLRQILEGTLSSKEALEEWPIYEEDSSINAVRHAVEHFMADEDIRRKDKKYAERQFSQLREFMEIMAEGKSINAREIGWLTPHNIGLNEIFKKVWKKIKGA